MELFPAIDIRGGKSVRLRQGDFSQETTYGDPVERAEELLRSGARRIHVVDLDAARSGIRVNRTTIEKIAEMVGNRGALLQVGGGVRDEDTVSDLLNCGVSRVVIGTAALAEPEMVVRLATHYPGMIVVGLDYRRISASGASDPMEGSQPGTSVSALMLASQGWTQDSGRSVEDAIAWFEGTGVAALVVTDISRDGMLNGPDLDGLRCILASTEIEVVASGGIGSIADLIDLSKIEVDGRKIAGAVAGKSLYDGRFSLQEALSALDDGNK